ncbi:MAG: aa3-type cytochrome c oxidase subunit IV [Caulobacteraceae bacterium]
MAEQAADYHHGDQDVSEQLASYRRFNALSKWGALHLAVLTAFFAIWFCTGAGFLSAAIPATIVMAVGVWFLSRKPSPPEI